MRRLLMTLPALALLALPVQAGTIFNFIDGNKLLQGCTAPSDSSDFRECLGYIEGASDMRNDYRDDIKLRACPPVGVSAQQFKDAVVKYLQEHIPYSSLSASTVVRLAILNTWQCSK
jgi:hypothetical protein